MLYLRSIGKGVVELPSGNQNVHWWTDGQTHINNGGLAHQSHQWSVWMHPIKLNITRCLSGDTTCKDIFSCGTLFSAVTDNSWNPIWLIHDFLFLCLCHTEASKFFWKAVPKISQPPPLLKGRMLWLTLGTFFENIEVKVLCIIYIVVDIASG